MPEIPFLPFTSFEVSWPGGWILLWKLLTKCWRNLKWGNNLRLISLHKSQVACKTWNSFEFPSFLPTPSYSILIKFSLCHLSSRNVLLFTKCMCPWDFLYNKAFFKMNVFSTFQNIKFSKKYTMATRHSVPALHSQKGRIIIKEKGNWIIK